MTDFRRKWTNSSFKTEMRPQWKKHIMWPSEIWILVWTYLKAVSVSKEKSEYLKILFCSKLLG